MMHFDSYSKEWIDSFNGDIRICGPFHNGWTVTTRAANWQTVSRHRLLARAKSKAFALIRKRNRQEGISS